MEVSGQLQAPATLPPETALTALTVGGWMGPISGLEPLEDGKILTVSESNRDSWVVQKCVSNT